MSRKTGKAAVKARQQMRAAKMAKQKRELAEAGVKLGLPKPSTKELREKEEELKRLYLELFPGKKAEGEPKEQAEQPPEEKQGPEEQPEQKEEERPAEGEQEGQPEQQEQAEEQPPAEQKEEVEQQEQAEEPKEKPAEQSG